MEISRTSSSGKQPKITINDTVAYWAIKLAKSGYYGGNPELVKQAPLDMVLQILQYERFETDLQVAYRKLSE